ncbi:MAG: hypothetical protein ABJD24_06740, partial [Acidimicrobiales bacterium]
MPAHVQETAQAPLDVARKDNWYLSCDGGGVVRAGRDHIVGDAHARPPVAEDPFELEFVVSVVRV